MVAVYYHEELLIRRVHDIVNAVDQSTRVQIVRRRAFPPLEYFMHYFDPKTR